MSAKDLYIGETFEDRDTRSEGRRLRVLERHAKQTDSWGGPDTTTYYRAIRVDEFGTVVGKQRVRISARTLESHYRKVSH